MNEQQPDWQKIAEELAKRVVFAINHFDLKGTGIIMFHEPQNENGDRMVHWRDYFADAIDMVPGHKVDRELLAIRELPRGKRAKAYKELEKTRGAL